MSTLKRDDGIQFVIQPYRELFPFDSPSALKRRIRAFSERHGRYVGLFKRNSESIEAAFSADAGILLGEAVWTYFNKPNNLIYCEELPERRQALAVIVRRGVILVDSRVPFTELIEEFSSLISSHEKYDIYVCGNVPLGESYEGGKFVFDKGIVNSFNILTESLLAKLPIYEDARLHPLEIALDSPILGKSKIVPIILASLGIIGVIFAWNVIKKFTAEQTVIKETFIKQQDPYFEYNRALTSPSPFKQLNELVKVLDLFSSLPGWKVSSVEYNGTTYSAQLTSESGSLVTQLKEWARENSINLSTQANGVGVSYLSRLANRPKPQNIYPLDDTTSLMIDEIDMLLNGKNITISEVVDNGEYKEQTMTINFTNIVQGALLLLGNVLDKFPVRITNTSVSMSDGLYSGNLTVKVLGD